MTIRQALSTIRLTQWADVEPLLRARVIEHPADRSSISGPLRRNLGQGLALEATIVLAESSGEATAALAAPTMASWNVSPDDIWNSAAVNTRRAAALREDGLTAKATHQGWRLTFVIGRNRAPACAIGMLDRSGAPGNTSPALWWSVLSPQSVVLLHPVGRRPVSTDEPDAKLLAAGLASVTDHRFPTNLFAANGE